MSRRRGVGAQRRPGFRGIGGAVAYSPLADVDLDLIAWWSPLSGMTLSGALVSSWLDRKAGYPLTAAGALRPTYSATAITDIEGVTHPGVVFAGAQGLSCNNAALKAAYAGRAVCSTLMSAQADQAHSADLQVLAEYGASFSIGTGEWIVAINDTNASSLETGVGYGGAGYWRTSMGECPLADPGVLQINLFGAVNGSTSRTLDGVEMLGTAIAVSATVPSVIGSQVLHVGSRTESTFFYYGALGDIILCGSPTAAAARRARDFMGAQIGALQA